MKKRIVVTGGTGYIGSHTAVELMNEGYEVILIDNLYNSEAVVADRIGEITGTKPQLEVFDLCKRKKLNKFFRENSDISAIIHFAAYKAVGESVNKPLEYYRNNLVIADEPAGCNEGIQYSLNCIFIIMYGLRTTGKTASH